MQRIGLQSVAAVLIKWVGTLAIALGVVFLVLDIVTGQGNALKEANKTLGSAAEYGAIAAGLLWLSRHVWTYARKNKLNAAQYMRQAFLFLKKHHTLVGYAVLSLSVSHGVYFLLKGSKHVLQFYSGIGAIIALLLVSFAGILLQKLGVRKSLAKYRRIHQVIASLFGIGLLIHLIV
ncbi:hypothetical protein [Ectobacillus ponti]|uniref:Uncharacterized protein n=1 Tax=Ectobacillus ponti TaxID=2961894 RepID=A0AA41XFU2_9BACI|nr:hypothetical protein [Ectobacillus ponti]MCP8971341.1 hypothetical protein [Ectobacillus ponti]